MALYPEANQADRKAGLVKRVWAKVTRRLLPESATQPRIRPRVVILHSAAGRGSLYRFFLNSSNLESHFWVSSTGEVEQYMDTEVRADANLKANGFAVSIETESSPAATEPWPSPQYEALVRLVRWICDTHGIPKAKVTKWDGTGIGWHIQFGAPGPWTPVSKSCPGPARIRQMPALISAVGASGAPPAVDPNAGRRWVGFKAGDTDRAIYRAGGLDNEVAELQILLDVPVTGTHDVVTVARWIAWQATQNRLAPTDARWAHRSSAVTADRIAHLRAVHKLLGHA
jgi:hypothetical protein